MDTTKQRKLWYKKMEIEGKISSHKIEILKLEIKLIEIQNKEKALS